ncbi:MAG: PAS domain S-box protein [Candidatus Saganbacteria bacterium]|nr:PAS domain S-box protein [Candidatus Saganbacteria bacterium]
MNLTIVRTFILSTGWPVLVIGSFFLLYKSIRFYKDVNKVIFGKLVIIMTAGWLFTMYCLGIAATVAMYLDLVIGITVVLPIFAAWAITMVILTVIILKWSKEAVVINHFYQDIERKYQSIFELSPEAILLLDTSGMIMATNDRLQEWLGHRTRDMLGKNIITLPFLSEDSKAKIMKNFSERLLGKTGPPYEIEFTNKKGQIMFGRVIAASLKDKDGNIIRNLTMISDVSEKVKLEKLRDDLMDMAVHDLKTPLTNIIGMSKMVLDDKETSMNQEQKGFLENILTSSKRLSNLVMDLIQVNNIEDSGLFLDRKPVSLAEIALGLSWLKTSALKRKIQIETNIQEEITLEADKDILLRVIENLISNAIKHTPQENSRIILNIQKKDSQILFEIIDNGEGIPQEYQKRIFDKFFKVEDQAYKTKLDTGLGLAFCKIAVEAHGGKIAVESEEGKGSRFYFNIPEKAPSINF